MRRWADLLLCEFHAHQILAEVRLANDGARLLDADGRRFLEIPRFDRSGPGGRRGVVSLEALASSLIGSLSRNWIEAAAELHRRGIIDSGSFVTIQRRRARLHRSLLKRPPFPSRSPALRIGCAVRLEY